jgi:hypothetical protein
MELGCVVAARASGLRVVVCVVVAASYYGVVDGTGVVDGAA